MSVCARAPRRLATRALRARRGLGRPTTSATSRPRAMMTSVAR